MENPRYKSSQLPKTPGGHRFSEFKRAPAEKLAGDMVQGQFQLLPLQRTDKARRGQIWIDLNKDGLQDLLVAEPESGQLSFYAQSRDGGVVYSQGVSYLGGCERDLAAADWDGDGTQEIFLLSTDERQVGVTRLDAQQRLAFPTLIPLNGRPLVFAVGMVKGETNPVLAVIVDNEGRRSLQLQPAKGEVYNSKAGRKVQIHSNNSFVS